jgi:hypothetical protein
METFFDGSIYHLRGHFRRNIVSILRASLNNKVKSNISGNVNRHSYKIWGGGAEQPQEISFYVTHRN